MGGSRQATGLSMCTGTSGLSPPPPASEAGPAAPSTAVAQVPPQLNGLTQQLFQQLNALATEEALPAGQDQLEAWKRDVLDLLFLVPGVVQATALPQPLEVQASEEQDYEIVDA